MSPLFEPRVPAPTYLPMACGALSGSGVPGYRRRKLAVLAIAEVAHLVQCAVREVLRSLRAAVDPLADRRVGVIGPIPPHVGARLSARCCIRSWFAIASSRLRARRSWSAESDIWAPAAAHDPAATTARTIFDRTLFMGSPQNLKRRREAVRFRSLGADRQAGPEGQCRGTLADDPACPRRNCPTPRPTQRPAPARGPSRCSRSSRSRRTASSRRGWSAEPPGSCRRASTPHRNRPTHGHPFPADRDRARRRKCVLQTQRSGSIRSISAACR